MSFSKQERSPSGTLVKVSYVPTLSVNATNAVIDYAYYARDNENNCVLEIRVAYSGGGGSGTNWTITLPTGLSINTTVASGGVPSGTETTISLASPIDIKAGNFFDASTGGHRHLSAFYSAAGVLAFSLENGGVFLNSNCDTNDKVRFNMRIPVTGW